MVLFKDLLSMIIAIKGVGIMIDKIISGANRRGGYHEYERVKKLIINLNLKPKQYEQAMRKLADRLGI